VDVDVTLSPACAPSVLIYFINMMLLSETKPIGPCDAYMFKGQGDLQLYFVIIAVLCIPVMLFGKPLYIKFSRKSPKHKTTNGDINQGLEMTPEVVESTSATSGHAGASGGHGDHEEEPFSEIMIHQAIHTIEYVLSTISHTASYLRLWALSLAHGQLSEVLWQMVFRFGFGSKDYTGAIIIYFVFAIWAVLTLAILVLMEGLSAFLHTLRLHWVEFMSKFYSGLGYPFQPFCFKTILETEEVPDE